MDLTTATRVKELLEKSDTGLDTLIAQLITPISQQVEKYLNRHAQEVSRTEQYTIKAFQQIVKLRGYPVLALPVAAFKNSSGRDFTGTAIDTTSYYLDLVTGEVQFDNIALIDGPGVFQAVYTGGMAANTAAFLTAFPGVAGQVDAQVASMVHRRHELGLASFSAEGGSISLAELPDLLPGVKRGLAGFRRPGKA